MIRSERIVQTCRKLPCGKTCLQQLSLGGPEEAPMFRIRCWNHIIAIRMWGRRKATDGRWGRGYRLRLLYILIWWKKNAWWTAFHSSRGSTRPSQKGRCKVSTSFEGRNGPRSRAAGNSLGCPESDQPTNTRFSRGQPTGTCLGIWWARETGCGGKD